MAHPVSKDGRVGAGACKREVAVGQAAARNMDTKHGDQILTEGPLRRAELLFAIHYMHRLDIEVPRARLTVPTADLR